MSVRNEDSWTFVALNFNDNIRCGFFFIWRYLMQYSLSKWLNMKRIFLIFIILIHCEQALKLSHLEVNAEVFQWIVFSVFAAAAVVVHCRTHAPMFSLIFCGKRPTFTFFAWVAVSVLAFFLYFSRFCVTRSTIPWILNFLRQIFLFGVFYPFQTSLWTSGAYISVSIIITSTT